MAQHDPMKFVADQLIAMPWSGVIWSLQRLKKPQTLGKGDVHVFVFVTSVSN